MKPNELSREIIGAAIAVHRELGPGKPEAAYESALAHELGLRGLPHEVQKPVPVVYKGVKLECGYRLDVLVANTVVVEAKSVECIIPIHQAQVLTQLRLGGWKLALLLNFNVAVLKEGITRLVLGLEEEGRVTAEAQRTQRATTGSQSHHRWRDNSGDAAAERLARVVVESAMEVHRELGPGLLPSAYVACLGHELHLRGMAFERKRQLTLSYKGVRLGQTDEVELLVGGKVVVTTRAVQALAPVHDAEMLSQLRLGGWRLGLLINFNTMRLDEGIRRFVQSRVAGSSTM